MAPRAPPFVAPHGLSNAAQTRRFARVELKWASVLGIAHDQSNQVAIRGVERQTGA